MEALLEAIMTKTQENNLKELRRQLRMQEAVLFRNALQLDGVINALDMHVHTLGLVFLLNVRASALAQANTPPATELLQNCRALLLRGNPAQLKLVPQEVAQLSTKFLNFSVQTHQPLFAVAPLLEAVRAIQPDDQHLTPMHAMALQACILSKCYRAAEPLIQQAAFRVDPGATAVSTHDVLLCHYYGGIALLGLRRPLAALASFQLVLTAPSLVLNSIMVEAYKKWLLCGLIAKRAAPTLPKYVANAVQRNIKPCVVAYSELSAAFSSSDNAAITRVLEQHRATFAKDGNGGLVKQVLAARTKYAAWPHALQATRRAAPHMACAPPLRACPCRPRAGRWWSS